MTEVLKGVERVARERVESLQRESGALAGEAEGFLLFAHENCQLVRLLSFVWTVMIYRLQQGGAPAQFLLEECKLLLTLACVPEGFLSHIARVWHQRTLPEELANPIYAEVKSARQRLDALVREIRNAQERVSTIPKVSANPEDLKQRINQADERQEWLPLRDVVTKMRQKIPGKQE
jgi:hypothetical protein